MSAKTLFLLSGLVLLSVVSVDGKASAFNLTIELTDPFPREIRYTALRQNIVALLTPCRSEYTSGGWDSELMDIFERARRPLADAILDHIVDEEFIPTWRIPQGDDYRSRIVSIDPFSFGRTDLQVDVLPEGVSVEVRLNHHLNIDVTRHRSRTFYGVTIWRWNRSDERDKSCGFSYF